MDKINPLFTATAANARGFDERLERNGQPSLVLDTHTLRRWGSE